MKTKCYSVRLLSLTAISAKAYKAVDFNSSQAILPKSQVFAADLEVSKSDAYWISAWILEKKELQYSRRKVGWYNPKTGKVEPKITIIKEVIKPQKIEVVETSPDEALIR